MLEKYRDTIKEIAFFTTSTGVPVQYRELAHGADILRQIIPDFKALGLRVGINHLPRSGMAMKISKTRLMSHGRK